MDLLEEFIQSSKDRKEAFERLVKALGGNDEI